MDTTQEIRSARGKFMAMAAAYCLGVFNDNYFKQAALLMAVSAGLSELQGTATVLFALPFILFSSWAGWLADRYVKRNVVIWAKALELAAMLCGAAGVLTGQWPLILAMVFLMGLQSAIFSPALNGSIPELYPAAHIPRANAILKLATTLSILAGIALAGVSLDQRSVAFGGFEPGAAMVAVVVVAVAALGLAASIGVVRRPAAAAGKPFPRLGPLGSVKDLFSLCGERQMLTAFFADNFFYFLATIVVLTINVLGVKQLHFSQTATSLLSMALMLGICLGSFMAARLVKMESWSRLLFPSALGMAAGLCAAGLTVHLPASLQYAVLATALTATGIFGGLFLIPVTSFLQVHPAPSEKGRVLATVNFSGFAAILMAGVVFSRLDAHWSAGAVMVILSSFTLFAAGLLRLLGSPKFNPAKTILLPLFRMLISLRYRVEVIGLDKIAPAAGQGILFLPNHPALIDPVIVMSVLYSRFRPRPLSDADQADMAGNRWVMRHIHPITLPSVQKNGRSAAGRIKTALEEVAKALAACDNILLYPAGRLSRKAQEDLAGNSGVEYLMRSVPGVRTVLVRTSGLWGSSFGWGRGTEPSLLKNPGRFLRFLLANGVFFGPRRKVTIELVEDPVLPGLQDRQAINARLENFYNTRHETNTHVPYFWWQGGKPVELPEPGEGRIQGDPSRVSAATRKLVTEKISQLTGQQVQGGERLAGDLAMDSLTLMELAVWLESEFGMPVNDLSALITVDDCILAAAGQVMNASPAPVKQVPAEWFRDAHEPLVPGDEKTVTGLFLARARLHPKKIVIADQLSGAKTYRQILTAILVLKPIFEKVSGERIGIMMPASVSASILYLAALFAGKTPVMINWTVGVGNVRHGLELTGVTAVVTARALYRRLMGQGVDLSAFETGWLFVDEVAATIPLRKKLGALLKAVLGARALGRAKVPETAAILFTSGSESRPKAVPLTHANIVANLRDFSAVVSFKGDNRLLGMLPPFHSLGLAGTIILPLCLGLRTVYHANPTEAAVLAGLIERYRASIVIGTPTFLLGILKAGSRDKLRSLSLVFTGAEKCPESTYEALRQVNPGATLCEGYGITECSPLVSINRVEDVRPGTIGRVMPSMEYGIIDPETEQPAEKGCQGLLLVRGPNIFGGYYRDGSGSGFSDFAGKRWYNTGDFVREDGEGNLTFCGRKKRFIKLGGEMISLPAIENVLLSHFPTAGDNGPALAVEATPTDERPEIVLFTTLSFTREEANLAIKESGLSPLHNIRILREIETIPVLGTGKTDYKQLKELIAA